ncbi:MAG: TA system VapC family ribonuclease toxin [Anaerolineaceae bacterium]
MIAVDTNILVYASRADSPRHQRSFAALAELAEGPDLWAIPWPCMHEFISVVTSARFYDPPTPIATAFGQVAEWLAAPRLVLLSEGTGHFEALKKVVADLEIKGTTIHDAKIAALCIANGVSELWSADRDFDRFPALRVRNPLLL